MRDVLLRYCLLSALVLLGACSQYYYDLGTPLSAAQLPMVAFTMPVPSWVPGKNDAEAAALAVATEIMSGGKSALFNQVLVNEKRSAVSAGAGYDPFTMGLDLWYAYGATGIGQPVEKFEQDFWALIKVMGKELPDARKFKAAKRRLVADSVFAQDSLYLRAKHIGRLETIGIGADQHNKWLDLVRSVKPEQVRSDIAIHSGAFGGRFAFRCSCAHLAPVVRKRDLSGSYVKSFSVSKA